MDEKKLTARLASEDETRATVKEWAGWWWGVITEAFSGARGSSELVAFALLAAAWAYFKFGKIDEQVGDAIGLIALYLFGAVFITQAILILPFVRSRRLTRKLKAMRAEQDMKRPRMKLETPFAEVREDGNIHFLMPIKNVGEVPATEVNFRFKTIPKTPAGKGCFIDNTYNASSEPGQIRTFSSVMIPQSEPLFIQLQIAYMDEATLTRYTEEIINLQWQGVVNGAVTRNVSLVSQREMDELRAIVGEYHILIPPINYLPPKGLPQQVQDLQPVQTQWQQQVNQ